MNKYVFNLILLLCTSLLCACASSPQTLDEKYIFTDLEQVDRVRISTIDGWSAIDKQSLIVSTSPKTSYLIILKRPHSDLKFAQEIKFDSAHSSVYAKSDRIEIIDRQAGIPPLPAYINRIYKLNDREQKKMVRAQIEDDANKHKEDCADK